MSSPPTRDPLDVIRMQSDSNGWGGTFEYATKFDEPDLNTVLALWHAKAKGGIPARTALTARDLAHVLPNLWMVEAVREGARVRYRVRRSGTAVASVMGDMTGRFLDEAIPPPLVSRWEAAAGAFLACARPIRFTTTIDLPHANFFRSEAFHAPLLDAVGAQTILMGVSYFHPA